MRASSNDAPQSAGMFAARVWLASRGLTPPSLQRWHVDILLDVVDQPARAHYDERVDTRFRIEIYSEEWGFMFCHAGQTSRIRVNHAPAIHGRDDFGLVHLTPLLSDFGVLLRSVEHRNNLRFRRRNARVETNLSSAEGSIRRWIEWL